MDILISDNWLRDFLRTKATPAEIGKYLSLCGPSVEKITKTANDYIYHVEVTTNRVDVASIYGFAREAAAILPRFNIHARLKSVFSKFDEDQFRKLNFCKKVSYLTVETDSQLCPRFCALLIKNVKIKTSPEKFRRRLQAVGIRPINNVVDISNYIMAELGQPVHTFDYDKIKGQKMVLRKSRPGEKIITLDGKSYNLPGNDIVIEDSSGELIDLCGIMGGKKSEIDNNTKNVLLFIQNYNPINIRKTSMALGARSQAATIFEKGIDSEGVTQALFKGKLLFQELTGGVPEKEILDIYPKPYRGKTVKLTLQEINTKLGIALTKSEVQKILTSLSFKTFIKNSNVNVEIPSFRGNDINVSEDIIEEVARLWGYHNFPNEPLVGKIPTEPPNTFAFEDKIKNIIKGHGGCEIYTFSLVGNKETEKTSLKLKNPLTLDNLFLRTTLKNSLVEAADNNPTDSPFYLFEIANIYLPRPKNLPEEKMMLAGLIANKNYRQAKGLVEALLNELFLTYKFIPQDLKDFVPGRRLIIEKRKTILGEFGELTHNGYYYYEFSIKTLKEAASSTPSFQPIPQHPPQIEDITFSFPNRTRIGDVIDEIKKTDSLITEIKLKDIYKDSFTFRINYQHPQKTLTNAEVKAIRTRIENRVKQNFGGIVKN